MADEVIRVGVITVSDRAAAGEYEDHGGPAVTVDSEGYLHVVYFPHHHAMRYRRSKRPNETVEWEDEIQFGERLTYPTLMCGPDNTLLLTARRSFPGRRSGPL